LIILEGFQDGDEQGALPTDIEAVVNTTGLERWRRQQHRHRTVAGTGAIHPGLNIAIPHRISRSQAQPAVR
jgi:hypothetical protein